MLRLRHTLSVCMLATALLASLPVHAATYYVATTGSNSNPGTSSKPWRNVAYAVSKMVAGDTTYVRGGVYNEGLIYFKRSGTQSAPIKLLNVPGQFPIIDCIDKSKNQMILISNGSGYKNRIGWITIEGFEIRDCSNAIKFYNLHDSIIRRNWIHHNLTSRSGILGAGGLRVVIDRNRLNNIEGHAIYINGTAITIMNNLIYNNRDFGIQLNGSAAYDPAKFAGPEFAASNDWLIANNTFAYQRTMAGMTIWGSRCNNTRVSNNIFYENSNAMSTSNANGIKFVSTSCTGIQIKNNLAYASGSGGTKFLLGSASYTQSGNIVNTLKPNFVNAPATFPSSPNFFLTSGSPAIDKGMNISTAQISYPGTTRPKLSAYDIGAYEYYSGSTLASPTSLQVAN
jgi:hypothetical protein